MSGKLKLKGDMGKAMALDKLMAKMNARNFSTFNNNSGEFFFGGSGKRDYCTRSKL